MAISYGPNLNLLVHADLGEEHYDELTALLRGLDTLVFPLVLNFLSDPPVGPSDGDLYVIDIDPTGAWAARTPNDLARWSVVLNAWEFYTPKEGWTIRIVGDTPFNYTYRDGGNGWGWYSDPVGNVSNYFASTLGNIPTYMEDSDGTNGHILIDSGKSFSTDGTLAGNSDFLIPTEQAVKTYVDSVVGGGGGGGSTLVAAAFVETNGNDTTAIVGDITKPFATINAALDALPATGGSIFLGVGRFAPIATDYLPGGSGLNAGSKLKSNIRFYGSGKPVLDSYTAPTKLVESSGTVIDGPATMHSTRHNVQFHNLGIDSGTAACAANWSGNTTEGLGWFNIGQVGGLAPAIAPVVKNVIVLCKAVNSPVHGFCMENVTSASVENLHSYFGQHGVTFKGTNSYATGIFSFGHSEHALIIKESNIGNDSARCHDVTISNVIVGSLNSLDTPYGIAFQTASTRALERINISGVNIRGVATSEIRTNTDSTGEIRNIRVDNLFTDNGTVRKTLTGVTQQSSVYINGTPLSGVGATPQSLVVAVGDETNPVTAGTKKVTFRMPYAMTLTGVRASLTTAQSAGSILTVDINVNDSSILSTKLTIDNGEKTSTTAAIPAVISASSLTDDAEITIDVDQIGSGTAVGLKITLIGTI